MLPQRYDISSRAAQVDAEGDGLGEGDGEGLGEGEGDGLGEGDGEGLGDARGTRKSVTMEPASTFSPGGGS